MHTRFCSFLGTVLLFLFGSGLSGANEAPRVVIFAGNPGNEEHHVIYESLLGQLSSAFTDRFGVSTERLQVFYGPKAAGYTGPSSRENIVAALTGLREECERGDKSPIWILVIGHANKVKGGSLYNLPGPDLSFRDLGREISRIPVEVPVVVWGTTTVSQPLLRGVRGPHRAVVSATGPKNPENETEFPLAFAAALQEEATDSNSDGRLTVPELFLATRAKVRAVYEAGSFLIKEQALLDGNGDGRGTSRPARPDVEGGNRFFLTLTRTNQDFD